jgi:hypothetical protein
MNLTALRTSFVVFNGILAIVLMIIGSLDNNMFQKIVGFVLAIIASATTYLVINNRDE